MVYSADVITGVEALAAHRRLASHLRLNLKREYSNICGFVQAKMSQAIVRYNILLIRVPWDKEARIRQRLDLADRTTMALLALWQD